ncbi:hypothetical protein H6P81_019455 [Aristolochia fimbriata]|uniref:Uncharacterized protein n=1 Tax=Aristolochia fimbriata TaxID=158543 RepID=A0AAV7DRS4_ARIFI|nr:hypothetical protein H6P81_019455 [Aristolochia fimbriata]
MVNQTNQNVSAANAVLLGALAPGVNGPTWSVIKITFLTLGVCLAAMLGLAFSSSDFTMSIHVILLVVLSSLLLLLLSSFLSQTGLVSVETQMKDIGLAPKGQDEASKEN